MHRRAHARRRVRTYRSDVEARAIHSGTTTAGLFHVAPAMTQALGHMGSAVHSALLSWWMAGYGAPYSAWNSAQH